MFWIVGLEEGRCAKGTVNKGRREGLEIRGNGLRCGAAGFEVVLVFPSQASLDG